MDCSTAADRNFAAIRQVNAAPKAPRAIKVTTKKNKAKKFVIRATDADGNRLVFKAGKVKKKAGKIVIKGKRLTFKPRKGFKGKSSVIISVRDGKGGVTRTKVNLVVKK
nr:cadherin-like domain-containing protein [Aeromicrobium duanguangcaii]